MTTTVIGVRHHSPACARLVRHVIREVRPRWVLVEGPADMNARLPELTLGHQPPLAIFTWYKDAERTHASWTPFCAYSPEWVALEEAHRSGASFRFMDLPAWHPAFAGVRNRYADRREHHADRYVAKLCARVGVDDTDALWDHLFEQPAPPEVLKERLDRYFVHLRHDADPGDRDGPREAYMRACIAWAEAQGGDVVVVCGGWHAPALVASGETLVASGFQPDASPGWKPGATEFPEVDAPAEGSKHDSWLVPYTYRRLDSFSGYESGMPSPGFYDAVWEKGPEAAAEALLSSVVARLRRKRQPVSTADLVATSALAQALGRFRGHAVLARTDVLDAVAGSLVKGALEVPLPWARRGTLLPRTDPLLVEVVAALSGERDGRLHPSTPRPPLVHDVGEQLRNADLEPGTAARVVRLQLTSPRDLQKSRLLHRLRVLGIPGFTRVSGPTWGTDPDLAETWESRRLDGAEAALIEAAAYGATLENAAAAKLLEELGEAGQDIGELARILGDAVFVGIESLATEVLERIGALVGQENDLGRVGAAASRLFALWRHGDLFGATGAAPLAAALVAIFHRSLWLVEGLLGADQPADDGHLKAPQAVREMLRPAPRQLDVPAQAAADVMARRAADPEAPPAIRGAGLGFGWAIGAVGPEATLHAVRAAAAPTRLGDFLAGLFALAREEVTQQAELIGVLDEVLLDLGPDDFLIALPSLRMAFSWFPPRERERLAEALLSRHGKDPHDTRALLRLDVSADVVARGVALEQATDAILKRFGLAWEPRASSPGEVP